MKHPWQQNKRYNSYSEYLKQTFGEKLQKLAVNAGFTCPNRDGTVGRGGCSYCNNEAFNPAYCDPSKSVNQQIEEGKAFHLKRNRRASKYLVYFQAYSNTYAPLSRLKEIYDQALSVPGVVGLVVGTRPDCVDAEKLDYFQRLAENKYVMIEYGIESGCDKTLQRINRGHSFAQSVKAIEETAKRGIKTGAHLIFGLPGETREEMLNEAALFSSLPLDIIKFHQLQIVKNTAMAIEYAQNPGIFNLFSLEDYLEFMVSFVEQLNPDIVIERIAGEVPPRFLAVHPWKGVVYDQILHRFELLLEAHNTWQGRLAQ